MPQARLAAPMPSGAHLRPYPMAGGEASSLLLHWEVCVCICRPHLVCVHVVGVRIDKDPTMCLCMHVAAAATLRHVH